MSTRFKRIVCLATMLAMLFTAGLMLQPLQGMRERYDLSSEPAKGLSPELALATQVLAWGRGLIIDVIWIRMESLKMADRFFELVQLADWACKLAPRFPHVWDFQSWNLAYNVSCRVPQLPDRFPWVWAAVELLRDEGIPQNPNSAMLYDRLAMLFFHKMGEQMDNANMFYKVQFGLMMHEILGGDGNKEALEALAAAPATQEELLRDEDVKRFHTECLTLGFDIINGFFEFYKKTPSVPEAVYGFVDQEHNQAAIHKVAAFARARRLREELKMDVALMLKLREQYGPFDWRSPYPHAVYWATRGLEKLDELEERTTSKYGSFGKEVPKPYKPKDEYLRKGEGLYEFERVMLERVIYGSMQGLVMRGRVLFDTRGVMQLEVGPDYRFADATLPLFRYVIENHGERFAAGATEGLKNFLTRGILEFYYTGDVAKSMSYYDMLKKQFPDQVGGLTYEGYRRQEMEYAFRNMTTAEARRLVAAYLMRSLVAIGCGDYDNAVVLEQQARDFAQQWNSDKTNEGTLRSTISFDNMRESVITDMLMGTGAARVSEVVRLGLVRELRKQGGDVLERVKAKLQQNNVTLPTPQEVDEKLKVKNY